MTSSQTERFGGYVVSLRIQNLKGKCISCKNFNLSPRIAILPVGVHLLEWPCLLEGDVSFAGGG